MAKEKYKLTDETFAVLSGNESNIAAEYDCDGSYIYAIKNSDSNDPYAHFRRLFRASARAGAKVQIWLNDLSGILANARPSVNCREFSAQIIEKIKVDAECAEKMIAAISDGELDKSECHEILAANFKVQENARKIEAIVQRRLGDIDEARK